MKNKIEKKQDSNTPLASNGVFEVEKESTKKGIEYTLKLEKIIISEEEIEKILKENRVNQRIVLLRHYPYNEEIEEDRKIIVEYNDLLSKKFRGETVDNERLSYLEKIVDDLSYKNFDEIKDERIRKIIKILFLEKDKLLFLYSNTGKQRVKNTGEDLIKVFSLNNIDYINLKGSDKSLPLGYIYIDMSSYFKDEYVKIKNNEENKKYETIVIVGNRTYSYGMNFISGDGDITIRESEKDFEKEGYIFHEYNESGKILRNTGNIIVTPENYVELIKIFNIEHNGIIDFQNKLNIYLIKNPELIKIYVKSEIEELIKYCLLKLIERKDLETLNEIFREEKFRKKVRLEDYERLDKNVYTILRYYLEVYYKVLEIRSKSLDLRIKKGEDIKPDFNFDREEYNEILELINTVKPIKYIEGKAGAGKSFLLSYIAEKLNEGNLNNNKLQKLYYPVYINLSGKGLDEINEIGIEIYKDYEVIYLIDSIDESTIYGEERKELDKKLLSLSKKGKVIITSRSGYLIKYDDENNQELLKRELLKNNQELLKIEKLQKELLKNNQEKLQKELLKNNQEIIEVQDFTIEQINGYLQKYFSEDIKKIEVTKNILLKLNGAGNNPLILSMVCEVVNNGELKNENGEVINLENITIIDIYSNIVELRLGEWNENINGRDVNKKGNIEEKRKKGLINKKINLSQIAYLQLLDGKNLKINQLDEIIDDENLDIESLNLLFRKGEDGEYDFVHQSFKEYFAYIKINEIYKLSLSEKNGNSYYNLIKVIIGKNINILISYVKFLLYDTKNQYSKRCLDLVFSYTLGEKEFHYDIILEIGKSNNFSEEFTNFLIELLNMYNGFSFKLLILNILIIRAKQRKKSYSNYLKQINEMLLSSGNSNNGVYYLIKNIGETGLNIDVFEDFLIKGFKKEINGNLRLGNDLYLIIKIMSLIKTNKSLSILTKGLYKMDYNKITLILESIISNYGSIDVIDGNILAYLYDNLGSEKYTGGDNINKCILALMNTSNPNSIGFFKKLLGFNFGTIIFTLENISKYKFRKNLIQYINYIKTLNNELILLIIQDINKVNTEEEKIKLLNESINKINLDENQKTEYYLNIYWKIIGLNIEKYIE